MAARPDTLRSAYAMKCMQSPRIDGVFNEDCWQDAQILSGFKQYNPIHGDAATFSTEVRIIYNNQAIYIAAELFDPSPDSILRQLGNRDDGSLNADWFSISLDTYDNQLDAYFFRVYASGVQTERRFRDGTYNAVWQSKTVITDQGWRAEIRIPYSAIRFPETDVQNWGLQIERNIRRKRESDQWALEQKGIPNSQVYWGKLEGISDIKAPLRLSLTPYLSTALDHYPYNDEGASNYSYAFSGGANLKYGINQSFTLDVSLLPDFSQVKSDNKVKNLSAFETIYGENRPFFKESMDLFNKGGLFYSRRIGRTPMNFYDVEDMIDTNAVVVDNPSQARLVNAVKLTGRTNDGLGIGVLNAITKTTYATIRYPDGHEEKIMTDPASNYNIVVLDQALKNNSSVYLINTNVWRESTYSKANVTGAGLSLFTPSNDYQISVKTAYALNLDHEDGADQYAHTEGYHYEAFAGKVSGNFQFNAYRKVHSADFDINDFGITYRNNEDFNRLTLKYNIYEPVWKVRNFYSFLQIENLNHYGTHKNINSLVRLGMSTTTQSYYSIWSRLYVSPFERYDYYEARTDGRFYIRPAYWGSYLGFSTDYRDAMAMDGSLRIDFDEQNYQKTYISIRPRLRINDKLSLNYRLDMSFVKNDKGYVDTDTTSNIIFGQREITGIENVITSRYMFKNNLSVDIWMRYYWYTGEYNKYYLLENSGNLESGDIQYPNGSNDFNFNAFNIDLKLNWEFAPGSNFSVVWKSAVLRDESEVEGSFIDNLSRTLEAPKLNNISVKILYYLDYQDVFKNRNKPQDRSAG